MEEMNISVGDLRDKLKNGGEEKLEYFDETTQTWKDLKDSIYFERNTGFPVPDKALEEISLIQIFDSFTETVIMLGLRDWKHQSDYEDKFEYPVKYIKCKDEIHLIESYLKLFKAMDPLIIYAWNGMGFDFPYIYNRLKRLGIDTDKMSNYGKVQCSESEFNGKTEFKFNADGHFYVDMMVVYKKFVFSVRDSYSLDNISYIELNENKVQHTEYSTFDGFYTGDYNIPTNPTEEQKNSKIYQHAIKHGVDNECRELAHSDFCFYGYKDPLLIKKIDDKLQFTTLQIMISEKMGVQISDALGTVKPWSQYLSNRSHQDNKVMPKRTEHEHPNVVGGFVKDPVAGKHHWVLSADVNSMYPLLGMVGFNMSPETFIPKHQLPADLRDVVLTHFNDQDETKRFNITKDVWNYTTTKLKEHNMSLGINGAVFKTDKIGMIPELVQEIYDSRKKAKKTMFAYEQRKILINEIIKERVKDA